MQTNARKPKKEWKFTGWHMLIITVSFFAVVFGMNLFLAISANRAWTGLVVKNTYTASQEYNSKLAATRAQHAMGWTSDIEIRDGKFLFRLIDGEERPIIADKVVAQINRPVGTKDDVKLELQYVGDGFYSSALNISSGVWNIYIVASFLDQPNFEHYYRMKIEGE